MAKLSKASSHNRVVGVAVVVAAVAAVIVSSTHRNAAGRLRRRPAGRAPRSAPAPAGSACARRSNPASRGMALRAPSPACPFAAPADPPPPALSLLPLLPFPMSSFPSRSTCGSVSTATRGADIRRIRHGTNRSASVGKIELRRGEERRSDRARTCNRRLRSA